MKDRAEHTRRMYRAGAYSYSFALYSLGALGMTDASAHDFLFSA